MTKGTKVRFKANEFMTAYEKEYMREKKEFVVVDADGFSEVTEVAIILPAVGKTWYTLDYLEPAW